MTEDRAADALREKVAEALSHHWPEGFVNSREGWVECSCGDRLAVDLTRDGFALDNDEEHRAWDLHRAAVVLAALDLPALLAAEREKALLAVQSYSEAELAAERERGRVDGLREAHRQILGLLGPPAPADLAEPAPGEGADRD